MSATLHQDEALVWIGAEHLSSGRLLLLPTRIDAACAARLAELAGDRPLEGIGSIDELSDEMRTWVAERRMQVHAPDEAAGAIGRSGEDAVFLYLPHRRSSMAVPLTWIDVPTARRILALPVAVQPIYVDKPREMPMPLPVDQPGPESIVAVAPVLAPGVREVRHLQRAWLDAGEVAYRRRPILKENLARLLLRGLKRHGVSVIDGNDGRETPYAKLLAVALVLQDQLRRRTESRRVGIILPPGTGGYLANIAVLLAGKVPVNLNFTASREAIESSVRRAGLDCFVTASSLRKKLDRFAWPPAERLLELDLELPRWKGKILRALITSRLTGADRLADRLGLPETGGAREAALLFTSGSSGEPKGVPLSHENVIANVAQFSARLNMTRSSDKLLACLPLFHSFGFTITLWFPLLCGLPTVTYPSPLDPAKLAGLIAKHRVTLLLSTPTFLRGFLRKIEPELLRSLRMVVTGAEKLPAKVAEAFQERFGVTVYEGYGLTETSPATNVNLPHPDEGEDHEHALPSRRFGSVGQLLPGMSAKIADPESGQEIDFHRTGMLWLRGPNIFGGYFHDEVRTREVLDEDGWFRTGDLGRFDEDGFLYIEGRLSRFSKIAGEMVPHETVEQAISSALGLDQSDRRSIAVAGIPDEQKGEALILLAVDDVDLAGLRSRLISTGLPALWVPKIVTKVESIPLLASGKLDLLGCERLARGE